MNRRQLLKSLAAAGVLSTSTACFGSFRATRWVYDLNKGISSNKFLQWLVFLGLCIIPVYEVAGLIDLWILNSLEFWFGGSSSAENGADERVVELGPDQTLWMRKEVEQGLLHMRYDNAGQSIAWTLEMHADGARVLDAGRVIASAREDGEGGVEVLSGGRVVERYSAAVVQQLESEYEQGGAQATVAWMRRDASAGELAQR